MTKSTPGRYRLEFKQEVARLVESGQASPNSRQHSRATLHPLAPDQILTRLEFVIFSARW